MPPTSRARHSHHDAEFAALIARFDELQLKLCAQVRVGLDWKDFHQASYRAISEFLREAGIITVSADEAVDNALTSVFYPHGIGHLLGLQVHDVGGTQGSPDGKQIERPYNHPFLRLTRKLEDGCVVTVEPGFYFIDQLLDEAKAKPIGKMIDWKRVAAAQAIWRRAHRGQRGGASGWPGKSHPAGVQCVNLRWWRDARAGRDCRSGAAIRR